MKTIYNSSLIAAAIFAIVFAANAQQDEDISLKPAKKITTVTSVQPQVSQPVNGEDVSLKPVISTSGSSVKTNSANANIFQANGVDASDGEKITEASYINSSKTTGTSHKGNTAKLPTGKEAEHYKTVVHSKHTGATPVVHPSGKEAARYKRVVHEKHTGAIPVVHPLGREAELKTIRKQ